MDRVGELTTLRGHDAPVTDCAVNPSGHTIASASWDKTVRVWDVATREPQATLRGHGEAVTACAFSPDNGFIATSGLDGIVGVLDIVAGALTGLDGHDGPVLDCTFSPDSAFVASVGADPTLRLWDFRAGEQLAMVALTSGLQCVALHPHRPMAVCGDHAGGVHLVDLEGMVYGPVFVTAVDAPDRPGRPVILCPGCRNLVPGGVELLGTAVSCPSPGCGTRLRVNPFVASTPLTRPSHAPEPLPRPKKGWFRRR